MCGAERFKDATYLTLNRSKLQVE